MNGPARHHALLLSGSWRGNLLNGPFEGAHAVLQPVRLPSYRHGMYRIVQKLCGTLYQRVQNLCTVRYRQGRGLMGHTPATARGRATRERILEAAADLIQWRGVAAVTLDDVERAAGVGRSQLYHYFDDRDDLIRSVIHSTVDTVLAAQEPLLLDVDSLAGIDRWFDAIVANGTRQDAVGGCAIGSLASQLSGRNDLTRQAFVDAFARWEAPLIAGLHRMQESGELRPDADVTELADLTMAAIQGGLLLAQVRRAPDQLRLALRGARAALEDELTPPP